MFSIFSTNSLSVLLLSSDTFMEYGLAFNIKRWYSFSSLSKVLPDNSQFSWAFVSCNIVVNPSISAAAIEEAIPIPATADDADLLA